MDRLALKVPPLVVTVLAAVLMWVLSRGLAGPPFELPFADIAALLVALSGLAIALFGVLAFVRAGTTVDPRSPGRSAAMVTHGVYRFSRNPMYLGFLLVLAGLALWLGSVAAVMVLPLFVLYLNRFQIAPEERALRERFGAEFSAYEARVRRWC